MCANYEKQLPRVQEQMMKDLNEKEVTIDKLKAENDKFKVRAGRDFDCHDVLMSQCV